MFRRLLNNASKQNPSLRIGFLLGSGVSIPAGMPRTEQITECVLSGTDKILANGTIRHHTDGTYCFHYTKESFPGIDEHVPRILTLLNMLKAEIDLYYVPKLVLCFYSIYGNFNRNTVFI